MAAVRFDGGLPVEWDGRCTEFMAFTSSLAIFLMSKTSDPILNT